MLVKSDENFPDSRFLTPFKPMKMPPIFVQEGRMPRSAVTVHQEAAIVKSL
ncbi:hypothetical protein [Agrobacterium arsenijevicii]|uniref:hypothetical protein n=1 Tax=Agrobacterium arsenijevicii TaxID=1585697 RepID=UPI000A9427C6